MFTRRSALRSLPLLAMAESAPSAPVSESEVRQYRGAPTLFVNGQPHTGLTFFFCRSSDNPDDVRRFADAGIHMFSGCFGMPAPVLDEAHWDLNPVRRSFDTVIKANPRVLILPRVILGWFSRKNQLASKYQQELQVDIHTETKARSTLPRFSFSSTVWREEGGKALSEFLRFCEREYGDHIVGYHLAAGASGEWAYSWDPVLSDYSEAQRQAFRRWLRRRYPAGDFDSVEIPLDRTRAGGQSSLLDPARDRLLIDYLTFHSETVAEGILHFSRIAKQTLEQLGRRKICGVFYGYHFKNMNKPAAYCQEGHFAQTAVLNSPDVDFIAGPYDYTGREMGNMYLAQAVTGSTRLHGKLHFCEDDTFTFLSKREPHRYWCPDRDATIGVFRRNLMGILREGGAAWYMDCGGNGPLNPAVQVDGWYRDEGLMRNFAGMQQLAAARLREPDHTPVTQVAVIVSDASVSYLRQAEAVPDAFVLRQMLELGALGASFDTYRAEDLELLFRQPWARNYRFLIFLNVLHLAPRQRDVIQREVKKDGRAVLWTYAAGAMTGEGLSTGEMQALTGFRLAVRNRAEPLIASCYLTGSRVLYGSERPINPVIYGADDQATVIGWFINTGDPAFLSRDFGAWRSFWSGAPSVPAAIVRAIAKEAGVHLYVETGDQVLSERGYLTLHAGAEGERVVRLPQACDVIDVATGEYAVRNAREFRTRMRRGQTIVWRIVETG